MRSLIQFAAVGATLLSLGLAPAAVFADPCPSDQRIPLSFSFEPAHPCDGDSVFLNVSACGPCVDLVSLRFDQGVQVVARMDARGCIARLCDLETMTLGLGRFRAGSFTLVIHVTGEVVRDSGACTVDYLERTGFSVLPCPSPELPYVDDIVVGRRVVCVTSPCPDLACPGDSIPVSVRGTFPDDCHTLRSITLLPSIATVIGPPTLQILIDDGGCLGRPCTTQPVPWAAKVMLPPLPTGSYALPVQLGVASCPDSFPTDNVHRSRAPFLVVQPGSPECSDPSLPCFEIFWSGTDRLAECDAMVSPGNPGSVQMMVAPRGVPLAGLQGDLVLLSHRLDDVVRPGLRVANITATGPAAGMQLQWRRTEQGARFVLFSDDTSTIPVWPPPNARVLPNTGWPVLIVTVEQITNGAAAQHSLFATNLLGSTERSRRVDECLHRRPTPQAIICSGARCDMTGDGLADVRDLVAMVNCLNSVPNPPWPTVCTGVDCDGNGQFQLEDVLCCGRFILRGPPNDSIAVRPEPAIGVDLGDIARSDRTLELPIVVRGAERMGAARLAFSFPANRFDVSSVEVDGGAGWLSLHEVRDGRILVGLISLSGEDPGPPAEVRMKLRLEVKPGQTAGGQIGLVEGEFSGRDGVGLSVNLGQPARGLGPPPMLSMTASQPNPFSRTTRFAVILEAAGVLDVGIYDLGGRKVASLYRGNAAAGRHDLEWNGRLGDGGAAPSGVYFLKAAMSGEVTSRRIVLLRD